MEFKIGAEVFSSYVNIVSKVINAKANLPLLNNVLIDVSSDSMSLTGTDLEVQVSTKTPVVGKKPGRTSVNAKLFAQYVSSIPKTETIQVKSKKGVLVLSSSVGSAEFATKDVDDFPLFDEDSMETLFVLPGEVFSRMVDNTIFACAKDDIRPILTGVNVEIDGEEVTMVALDTFRLSKMSGKSQEKYAGKRSVVIPSEAMDQVVRVIRDSFISTVTEQPVVKCSVAKAGNYVLLTFGDVSIYARLVEGEYPNYQAVIPTAHQTEVTVSRSAWLESLKRVGVFAQSAIGQKVVLTFEGGKLLMESKVPEVGNIEDSLDVTHDGEPLKIAFQSKFLLDILTLSSDDSIVFRASSKISPGVFIQPTMESFLHILMPLKLDE